MFSLFFGQCGTFCSSLNLDDRKFTWISLKEAREIHQKAREALKSCVVTPLIKNPIYNFKEHPP
jgi:hypothetical protein